MINKMLQQALSLLILCNSFAISRAQESAPSHYEPLTFLAPHARLDNDLVQRVLATCPPEVKMVISDLQTGQKDISNILVLVGEPGTGKTTIAKVIADLTGRGCLVIRASRLTNEYQNSGDQNLVRTINAIAQRQEPWIIVLDEITSIVKTDKESKASQRNLATTLWTLLDDYSDNPNLFFVATANDLDDIPLPLQSRLEGNIVKIEMPNEKVRKDILDYYLAGTLRHEKCDETYIKNLARKMHNYTARDIQNVVMLAKRISRSSNEAEALCDSDFMQAMAYKNANRSDHFDTSWYGSVKKALKTNPSAGTTIQAMSLVATGVSLYFAYTGMQQQYALAEKQSVLQESLFDKQADIQEALVKRQMDQQVDLAVKQATIQYELSMMQQEFQSNLAEVQMKHQEVLSETQLANQKFISRQQLELQNWHAKMQSELQTEAMNRQTMAHNIDMLFGRR